MAGRRQDDGARGAPALGEALAFLAERELVVVVGKGGTGRSSIAALLARHVELAGRGVLLLDSDPRESLHRLFGVEPSGGAPVRISPRLTLQLADPLEIVSSLVRQHVPVGVVARRIIASSAFRQIIEGAPGLAELALLARACRVEDAPGAELAVLDPPATGHALALLEAPSLVAGTIADGPIRDVARRVAEALADPARTAFVVVTTAEELPVDETIELLDGLRRIGLPEPRLLVVNALYPEVGARDAEADPAAARFLAARRAVGERHLSRLGRTWRGPRLDIPLLPSRRGDELLAALVEQLEGHAGR